MIPIKIIIYKEKGAWNEICHTVSCTSQNYRIYGKYRKIKQTKYEKSSSKFNKKKLKIEKELRLKKHLT